MKLAFYTLAASLAVSGPAFAQFQTGNDVLLSCNSTSAAERMYCIGYIAGAHDELVSRLLLQDQPNCAPARYTAGQVRDMTVQYLQQKPQHRHLPANYFVVLAFLEAWGCK